MSGTKLIRSGRLIEGMKRLEQVIKVNEDLMVFTEDERALAYLKGKVEAYRAAILMIENWT